MISSRIRTKEEVEAELRARGFVPTDLRTDTGTVWRSTTTGKHIIVPDPYDDGMYPDFILRDMKELVIDTRRTLN